MCVTSNRPEKLQVLRLVQKYISARWEPFRDVVKNDSKSLVVEVCEVFSVSEKVLGDLIDRKQAQMDHAAKGMLRKAPHKHGRHFKEDSTRPTVVPTIRVDSHTQLLPS
jgi:hypothetical protein